MKALVTDGQGRIWDEERERPEPTEGEALVKIRAVGICGSDIGIIHGGGPPWLDLPVVPGHEVCAEVVELGPGVESLAIGDRVALHGFIYCGTCHYCRTGRYYQCEDLREVGFTIDGGYREYATFPASTLTPLPDDITDLEATQIDTAACTLHGLQRVNVDFADTACVLGPGSLGLFGVQLLRASGIDDVAVTGLRDERLAVAERYGATRTVNVRSDDAVAAIREHTDGRGVDLCLETAGDGDVVDTCLKIAGKGGDVVLLGIFDERKQISPDDIVLKELNVVGGITAAHATDDVIDLFRRDGLTTDGIVTHQFDLEEYDEAIDTVRNRRDGVIKAVLTP